MYFRGTGRKTDAISIGPPLRSQQRESVGACSPRMAAPHQRACCGAAWNTILGMKIESGFPRSRKETKMLAAVINFLRAWKRYNAGLNELYRLGDRELADIGLTRGDIPRGAWENAHRVS